jgi:DNA invertase Pin-like site-specific DNA recombinase
MSKHSKLNEQQIAAIKRRYAEGESQTDIAGSMKVNRQLVWYHTKAKPRKTLRTKRVPIVGVLS